MRDFGRRDFIKMGTGLALSSALVLPAALARKAHAAAATPEYLTMVGGGQGGAWYLGAAAIAELSKKVWPGVATTVTPGGGISNLKGVGAKKIEVGFAFAMDVTAAYKGMLKFEGKPVKNLRALMSTNGAYLSTVAKPDIKSYADLAGKSAAPGRAGMTGLASFERIVAQMGVAKDVKIVNTGYGEMSALFQDNVVQSATVIGSIPHPVVDEILSVTEGHLLPVDDAVADALGKAFNYEKVTIPAGTFKGQDKDVPTIGSVTQVTTYAEMPDEWAYNIVKTTWENRKRMVQAHKAYGEFGEEIAVKGVRIPFHPGAAQYWKEIGLLK